MDGRLWCAGQAARWRASSAVINNLTCRGLQPAVIEVTTMYFNTIFLHRQKGDCAPYEKQVTTNKIHSIGLD